jgi:hypothetical protein
MEVTVNFQEFCHFYVYFEKDFANHILVLPCFSVTAAKLPIDFTISVVD